MHLLMTIGGVTFIFITTVLGAALVFCLKKEFSHKWNAIFLGFTAGIMIAASVWSLLLPALEEAENGWGRYAFIPVSIGIFFGALFLHLADKFLPSAPQMQVTAQEQALQGNAPPLQNPLKLFFAITLHNIPEGLAVGFAFGSAWAIGTEQAFALALGLAIGVGIQNIPEGAAVSLPLQAVFHSKTKAFLFGAISGIFELIFAVIGCLLAAYLRPLQPWLLAFSAGAMLFVVAEDLLPSANAMPTMERDKANGAETPHTAKPNFVYGAWGATVGFVLMMILDVFLG